MLTIRCEESRASPLVIFEVNISIVCSWFANRRDMDYDYDIWQAVHAYL